MLLGADDDMCILRTKQKLLRHAVLLVFHDSDACLPASPHLDGLGNNLQHSDDFKIFLLLLLW
jgi:hypothetical protein